MADVKPLWSRLKNMRCPMCNGFLGRSPNVDKYFCNEIMCNFEITSMKFNFVVNNMYNKKAIDEEMDNQHLLNEEL